MNTQHINLDVTKRPAVMPVIYLGQGDKNGTIIQASIYDGGAALPLSGMSAKFCMRTPDGEGYYETAGTVSGNTATFQIDETYAANVAGTTDVAYVEILQGETVVCSTNRFRVVIHQNATEGTDPAQAWTNGVEEFLEDAQEQIDQAVAAAEEATEAAEAIVDYNVPLMSPTQRGGAKIGAGLQVGADEKLGVKVDGETITVDQDGTMHGASTYTLPTMSPTTKGGAKLGNGLSVSADEKLNLGPLVKHSTGVTDGSALYGVQGEGYATQSGTPTPDSPQPIMVARGRNLLDIDSWLSSRTTYTKSGDVYTITNGGTAWSNPLVFSSEPIEVTISGAISAVSGSNQRITLGTYANGTFTSVRDFEIGNSSKTATANALRMDWSDFGSAITLSRIQLERGTIPTPYVPHGHMGLEVTVNGQTTVKPVPMPSKGFVGSVPDGTCETLTIDSAGGYKWVNKLEMLLFDGSSDEGWTQYNYAAGLGYYTSFPKLPAASYGDMDDKSLISNFVVGGGGTIDNSAYFGWQGNKEINCVYTTAQTLSAWQSYLAANPMTVLYELATYETEQGYIDLPDLPEGATVTIPELDNVGVDYWVKGIPEVTEYGQAMQVRLQGEIDEAEQAIADNAAAITTLQGSVAQCVRKLRLNTTGRGSTEYIASLNSAGNSIPDGVLLIELCYTDWQVPVATIVSAKMNNTYGIAFCVSYYITGGFETYLLSGGTWSAYNV